MRYSSFVGNVLSCEGAVKVHKISFTYLIHISFRRFSLSMKLIVESV